MNINFFNLKELSEKFNSSPTPPGISENSSSAEKDLTEHVIQKMFDLHMQASKTMWDRKMFDDELDREGSGFIICFSDDASRNPAFKPNGSTRGDAAEINMNNALKLNIKSEIIGFFIFYTVLDEMHILDITVAKEMQSKGIGSALLDYVFKKYKNPNIKYFFLEVRASNFIAINLYKKFGFKIFMSRKKYYEDNGEDALCMVKEL